MKEICPKDKCTGCAACFNACGKKAITMTEDACGYVHPKINQELCVDCGLCAKVCPVNTKVALRYPLDCYAATMKSDEELLSCASGGIATELSRYVIDNEGVVYGCTGKDIRNVHHIRVDRKEDLQFLKGSKYVQSFIGEIYQAVKKDLQTEKLVLFIGTPCQVAGLQSFLRQKDYPNLITADLVCHGVPSQKMLNDNISFYCKENEDISVWFRQKEHRSSRSDAPWHISYGWFYKTNHMLTPRAIKYYKDPYMFGFLAPLTFRNSCYTCRYANISRCSDFTLGDFWGLGTDADFIIGKGVSEVLINTQKASITWNHILPSINYTQRDVVEAQMGNGQLQCPSRKHKNVNKFILLYPKTGLNKAIKECVKTDLLKLFLKNILSYIKICYKHIIK